MPKKIISMFFALLLLFSLPAANLLTAYAEEVLSLTFEGKTYDIPVGETFTFETKVTMPEYSAAGGRVVLNFDSDMIEVVGNRDNEICETDLKGVAVVSGYTGNGMGCAFTFAGTQYSSASILSGDKNTLVRFFFKAKAAGTTELIFDTKSFDYTVFTSEDALVPESVVLAGTNVGSLEGFSFIGNFITVSEIEDYQEQTDPPAKQEEPSSQATSQDGGEIVTDSGYSIEVNGSDGTIKGGNSTAPTIVIPETVTGADGSKITVNEIGKDAFLGSLANVIYIPASVTVIPDYSVGYKLTDGKYVKIDGFTIYGHKGSAAEAYALANGFTFIDADETPLEPTQANGTQSESSDFPAGIIVAIVIVVIIAAAGVIIYVLRNRKKSDEEDEE